MEEFFDNKKPGEAHDDFQRWRRNNPSGFFLALSSKSEGKVHTVACQHIGDPTLTTSDVAGSLTAKRKVCDTSVEILSEWAAKNAVSTQRCKHCISADSFVDAPTQRPEKVVELRIHREQGWRYVAAESGVWRIPANLSGEGEVDAQVLSAHGERLSSPTYDRAPGFDYFVDLDGDVARTPKLSSTLADAERATSAGSRRQVRIIDGDSVILDGDRLNVGIVESRNGSMLRVRFPSEEYRSEVVERSRLESLSELIADACRRGAKFSNSLNRNGKSSLAELVAFFGYRADARLRRDSLDRVTRQLFRAGIQVEHDDISRDSAFRLTLLDPAGHPAASVPPIAAASTSAQQAQVTAAWIRRHHPTASISFEEQDAEPISLDETGEDKVTRVDLFAKDVGVFEIESLYGSGPMEDFYQRKVFSRIDKIGQPFHLVVPSDTLLWAGPYLADLAERMSQKKSAKVMIPATIGDTADTDGAVELIPLVGAPLSKYRVEILPPTGTTIEPKTDPEDRALTLSDIAGYDEITTLLQDEVLWALRNPKIVQGTSRAAGILFYGPPGCGKTHIARALCGALKHEARFVAPSDLKGLYLGWGQAKIREQFQWLLDDDNRVLLIDEVDAVARSRHTGEMHSDEKADVNELLVQLDRASRVGRLVLCTTNYVSSLDDAVVRTGRFGHFVPVPPPSVTAATAIAMYYLSRLGQAKDGKAIAGLEVLTPSDSEVRELLELTLRRHSEDDGYFCNADIQHAVTQTYRRCARAAQLHSSEIQTTDEALRINLSIDDLKASFVTARRSIPADAVRRFLDDVREHSSRELYERFHESLLSLAARDVT